MKGAWAAAAIIVVAGCAPRAGNSPADAPGAVEARREIWAEIQTLCAQRGLEPGFVYALVKVESDFDPHASRGEGRGAARPSAAQARAGSALSSMCGSTSGGGACVQCERRCLAREVARTLTCSGSSGT